MASWVPMAREKPPPCVCCVGCCPPGTIIFSCWGKGYAIRYIKKIPDCSVADACLRFVSLLKTMPEKDTATLVRLSQKYPPATRALLGALLEEIGVMQFREQLQKYLNPITKYKLPGVSKTLKTAEKWNLA